MRLNIFWHHEKEYGNARKDAKLHKIRRKYNHRETECRKV